MGKKTVTRRTTILRPGPQTGSTFATAISAPREIAAVVGEHPFLSAAELAARKLTATNTADNLSMTRGHYLEDAVARWWGEEHGVDLVEPGVRVRLRRLPACHPGPAGRRHRRRDQRPPPGTVDNRSPTLARPGPDPAAVHRPTSARTSSYSTPACSSRLLTSTPTPSTRWPFYRAAATFLDYIRRGQIPPEVDMTYKAATDPAPRTAPSRGSSSTTKPSNAARELRRVQQEIKTLEADEDHLKGTIADSSSATPPKAPAMDNRVVTWRAVTRTGVDVKRLRAERPDIAGEYRQDSTYRQLRLAQTRSRNHEQDTTLPGPHPSRRHQRPDHHP